MSLPNLMTEEGGVDPTGESAGNALAEIGGDLQAALARYMQSTTGEWRSLLTDLEGRYDVARWRSEERERENIKGLLEYTRYALRGFERMATEGPPTQDHLTPADFSWIHVSEVWGHDEAAGRALWERIKQTARDELQEGKAGAFAIEGHDERPMRRAEYLAVWLALADGLRPANGAERLLIDGMAQALMMQRHWLQRMVQTESLDTIRRGERAYRDGYAPPRLSEADAVDRAVAMQDRFQRQFLRLMKCYRDGRRLIGSMTVLGGQVNVAEQQVVANGAEPAEALARVRAATTRAVRTHEKRKRRVAEPPGR